MSNADEVKQWILAAELFEDGKIEDAILKFQSLTPNAKIIFNIGCCFLSVNDTVRATQKFIDSVRMDPHFAIAHFLLGEVQFSNKQYKPSLESYQCSHTEMRGRKFVDYRPLGLNHILHAWQILANEAVLSFRSSLQETKSYITEACKNTSDINQQKEINDKCFSLGADNVTNIFTFPNNILFKPPKDSIANVNRKNYLGEAKVVSTENEQEIYSRFSGMRILSSQTPSTNRREVTKKIPPPKPPPPKIIPNNNQVTRELTTVIQNKIGGTKPRFPRGDDNINPINNTSKTQEQQKKRRPPVPKPPSRRHILLSKTFSASTTGKPKPTVPKRPMVVKSTTSSFHDKNNNNVHDINNNNNSHNKLQTDLRRRTLSLDDDDYSIPDCHIKCKPHLPPKPERAATSTPVDCTRLEKTIYGNIFTEVLVPASSPRSAPKKKLPVLTEEAKKMINPNGTYPPRVYSVRPRKPLPNFNA